MTRSDSALQKYDPSQELTRPKHERFAQLVALDMPSLQAAREAGYEWNGTPTGNAANARRLAQRRRIRERVKWWRGNQAAEVMAEKRRLLEEQLWLYRGTDIADFYETVEEPIFDRHGNVVADEEGKPLTRAVQRLRPFCELSRDQRRQIKSLTYTEKGRPNLELYSALDANRDLRKLNGLDMQRSDDGEENITRMSDEELHEALARQAAELGINVTLSYDGAPRA